VGVNEGPKETFSVISGARQLFEEVRAASARAPKEWWVGGNVCDMNAVRPSVSPLKDAASSTRGVRQVVRNIGQTSAIGIYSEICCHGDAMRK
jgi:hypothetical protein